MAKSNFAINSVGGGEVSPKFYGRFDTNPYPQGCEEVLNAVMFPQGGVGTRPGTMQVKEITQVQYPASALIGGLSVSGNVPQDNFTDTRVFPFLAADGTRIQIIAKNRSPYFYNWTGTTVGASGWQGIDIEQGTSILVKVEGEELSNFLYANSAPEYDMDAMGINLQEVQHFQTGNRIYFTHKKMRTFWLEYQPTPQAPVPYFKLGFLIGIRAISDGSSASQYLINAAKMPFQAPNFPPLTPTAFTAYTAITITTSSPVYDYTLSVTISLTAIGVGSNVVLHSGWVGRYIRVSNATTSAMVMVTAYNSGPNTLTAVWIAGAFPAGTINYGADANTYWEVGYWGGSYGWPASGTFYEERLFLGGGLVFTDTYWGSKIANIENFQQKLFVQDSAFASALTAVSPLVATLKQDTLSEIRWMNAGKQITVGTNTREFVIAGSDPSQTISIFNLGSSAETPHGSAYVDAVRIENTTVFLQRHRRALREISFSLDEQSFKADNISIFAEHMAEKSGKAARDTFTPVESYFVMLAMQQVPDGLLWALDNDGVLSCITRERTQQVQAWHRHEIAGDGKFTVTGVDYDYKARVRSISVIQRSLNNRIFVTQDIGAEEDELWMTVVRGVGTAALGYTKKHYVEMLAPFWRRPTIHQGWITNGTLIGASSPPNWRLLTPVYMDAAWVLDKNGLTTDFVNWKFSNLPHRVGSTVSVNLQGHDLGEYVVQYTAILGAYIDISDKAPDLTLPASWGIIIGYKYTSRVIPVVSEIQQPLGVSHGQMEKIAAVVIHFLNTIACTVGRATSEWDPATPASTPFDIVNFPAPATMDVPRQMYSGERKVDIPPGYETRPRVVIENSRPLPMNFTHIVVKRVVNES